MMRCVASAASPVRADGTLGGYKDVLGQRWKRAVDLSDERLPDLGTLVGASSQDAHVSALQWAAAELLDRSQPHVIIFGTRWQ